MNHDPAEPIKAHWDSVQNDAVFDQSNLIEIVRFLARCAAERDLKQRSTDMQERQGSDD